MDVWSVELRTLQLFAATISSDGHAAAATSTVLLCAAIAFLKHIRHRILPQVTKKTNQKTQARRSSLKVRRAIGCQPAVCTDASSIFFMTYQSVLHKSTATCMRKDAHQCFAQAFIKTVNYQHLMPTRYTLDVDLKSVVTTWGDLENSSARTNARKVWGLSTNTDQHVLLLHLQAHCREHTIATHWWYCKGTQQWPQEAKKLLEEKFKTGKNRWFFTKLRF